MKITHHTGLTPRDASGFSLTEVAVSLGIASFCFIALFGLLPVGLGSNQVAVEQTMAAGVATSVVADIRSAGNADKLSPALRIALPAQNTTLHPSTSFFVREDGTPVGTPNSPYGAAISQMFPRYRVTVDTNWQPNNPNMLWSRIRVSWPPLIALDDTAKTRPAGVVEVMTSINRRP